MGNDKIITAWDKINPDNATKEKILQEIQDTIKTEKSNTFAEKFYRFSIGFATAVVVLVGSFGTAYAASPTFREYIHSLLFPLYTSDEIVSIENGHMTGSFDHIDVLLTFLDKFNKMEFRNNITATKENGYHYSLFVQGDNQLIAFVDSNVDGYCIAVYMEQITYENTTGIWQVTGYQILEKSTAQNMEIQLEPYSDVSTEETISSPSENTSIKGVEDSIIIYNVNEKENVVSLRADDCQTVSNILDMCDKYSDIYGELFQYVIKINDISYMFDSNGNGMVNNAGERLGIAINENDMVVLKTIFELYNVSLEEVK